MKSSRAACSTALLTMLLCGSARPRELSQDEIDLRLRKKVSLKLNNAKLSDALPELQRLIDVPIVLDESAVKQGLDKATFSVAADNESGRMILGSVMRAAGAGLHTQRRNGAIHIAYADPLSAQVSMVFQRADFRDVIQTIGIQANIPITFDPALAADAAAKELSLRFENMRAEHALKLVTRAAGLDCRIDGKAVFVTKLAGNKAAPPAADDATREANAAMKKALSGKISVAFKDADIRDVINTFAIQGLLNLIVAAPGTEGSRTISINVDNAELGPVMDLTLKSADMRYIIVDGAVFIESTTSKK